MAEADGAAGASGKRARSNSPSTSIPDGWSSDDTDKPLCPNCLWPKGFDRTVTGNRAAKRSTRLTQSAMANSEDWCQRCQEYKKTVQELPCAKCRDVHSKHYGCLYCHDWYCAKCTGKTQDELAALDKSAEEFVCNDCTARSENADAEPWNCSVCDGLLPDDSSTHRCTPPFKKGQTFYVKSAVGDGWAMVKYAVAKDQKPEPTGQPGTPQVVALMRVEYDGAVTTTDHEIASLSDSVSCSSCKNWFHRTCDPSRSVHAKEFRCTACQSGRLDPGGCSRTQLVQLLRKGADRMAEFLSEHNRKEVALIKHQTMAATHTQELAEAKKEMMSFTTAKQSHEAELDKQKEQLEESKLQMQQLRGEKIDDLTHDELNALQAKQKAMLDDIGKGMEKTMARARQKQPRPEAHICPITGFVMSDPVCTIDGHTYERAAIEEWFAKGKTTSPKTNLGLEKMILVPNLNVKNWIRDWQPYVDQTGNIVYPHGYDGPDLGHLKRTLPHINADGLLIFRDDDGNDVTWSSA